MTTFIRTVLLEVQSHTLQFKRFRGKINIQKPRKPHYDRALFNAVTQPRIIEPTVTQQCFQRQQQQAVFHRKVFVNPYERIIAKEVANWFAHSQMVCIFHVNSIMAEDMFKVRVALFKQNIHLKVYGKSIMKQAIGDTKYKEILPLFNSSYCIVFSPEPKIPQLLKIMKKVPQLMLLAGIVEDRLMSKTELTEFAALPSLEIARAQFVSVLQAASGGIVNDLQAHQNHLCSLLDVHAKQKADAVGDTKVASTEEPPTAEKK